MQSLASLMSVKPSDVGNLDDFAESDEDEANGPGAPRGTQSGRLPVVCGLTVLWPMMDVAPLGPQCWLLWGRPGSCIPSDRSSVLPSSSDCPSLVLVLGVSVLSRVGPQWLPTPSLPGHLIPR